MSQKPILFDLDDDDTTPPQVSAAPPVPDLDGAALGDQLGAGNKSAPLSPLAVRLARKPSPLGRLFWSVLTMLAGAILSLWVWDFLSGLIDRLPVLGWAMVAGVAVLLVLVLGFLSREVIGLIRMRRVDRLRSSCEAGMQRLEDARDFANEIVSFYRGRADLAWAQANIAARLPEIMDADALMDLIEAEYLSPLDAQALAEVEASARQVATVTALVPLALADVVVALGTSLRMIRRIGEIYGGRSGGLAAWRLIRRIVTHLAATGAMAVGDDLLEPILGGSLLSKVSRRFGEGVVNGALSARVGLAAMDLCRPMPFSDTRRPKTRKVIQNALKGIVRREG